VPRQRNKTRIILAPRNTKIELVYSDLRPFSLSPRTQELFQPVYCRAPLPATAIPLKRFFITSIQRHIYPLPWVSIDDVVRYSRADSRTVGVPFDRPTRCTLPEGGQHIRQFRVQHRFTAPIEVKPSQLHGACQEPVQHRSEDAEGHQLARAHASRVTEFTGEVAPSRNVKPRPELSIGA